MRLLVYPRPGIGGATKKLEALLKESGVDYEVADMSGTISAKAFDAALVLGEDRDVLRFNSVLGENSLPIMGVSDTTVGGFLASTPFSSLPQALRALTAGRYFLEEAFRLSVSVDDANLPPAINEVAVFPWRSATLMEYTLLVDGETIWRDFADGVVVATPTGSTAYAMSAGGPLLHSRSEAVVAVSANSMDVTRRPLVVSKKSVIKVEEIVSRYRCFAIVDGVVRAPAKDSMEVTSSQNPARFIRPAPLLSADRVAKKVRLADELLKMPPSAKLVLRTLEQEGPLTPRTLVEKTLLPERTARLAIRLLMEKGLVKRRPLLRDARHHVYFVA